MDKQILYKIFNNEASLEEEKEFLIWLDENPAHQQELIAERKLFDAMILHGSVELKSGKVKKIPFPKWGREILRYAAVILVLIGISMMYVSNLRQQLLHAHNTVIVPAGQRVNLVLPDGTKVWLNALSELTYPAYFMGDNRSVKLTGEAFFDVTHDKDHPFIVETYACDVEVLGTKFDVEARPYQNEFTTSLVEGKVRVIDRLYNSGDLILKPNERVYYSNSRLLVDRIPDYERFQWRDGLISFRDATFLELIQKFEKYYGVNIEMQRTDIPSTLFTGKIRISEGVEHALWVLKQSADFTFTRNETKEMIYIQ